MAPKSSQRTSLGSSQPQPFQAAVTKLCNAIDDAKGKKGEIKAQSIVNKLNEYISNYRQSHKILGSETINLVVACLENDGDNVCSRLDPAIFCTVVDLILQTESCIEGERCLFLLGKSLFDEAQDLNGKNTVEKRKARIGAECRQRLLKYFIDESTEATMRRWAGVLCVQLFSDCEENCEWMRLGPENYRRNIGRAVVDEPDELLRMIYGQLLRCCLEADMPLKNLFPADFDEVLYADFPASTQGATGWGGAFQTYVDQLYTEELIDTPPIGSLFLATTIGMRPEYTFGAAGHTKYVFLYETPKNSFEISILAPAQSGFFYRILDIPVRSIKALSIVPDEYSQSGSSIGLDLDSGDGNEYFLDSEKIELSSIYLTFQPGNSGHFRAGLIGACPGLKVAQSNKEDALNPASSDDREPLSQVSLSEEIIVGGSVSTQRAKDPSSAVSQGPRLRENSIRKIPAEQVDIQISIDGEDELQNSVDASVPNLRDEQDEEATPQTTKEQPKVTPASGVSGSKSSVPPKGLKGGVKPKAKPPIVQRDLHNKPSQTSAQQPVAAAGGRTRKKQKQKESVIEAEEKLLNQGVKGKQKQPQPASTAPFPSVVQVKGTSDNATKMPPPQSKPIRKTRSARSSQVTDDILDSQVSDESRPLLRGTQKSSIDARKPNTTTSKTSTSHEVSANKSKSGANRASKPSQASKKPEYHDFSDDFITDVDEIDASTPKITAEASQTRKKTTAASISKTQTNKLSDTVSSTTQKRYSLYPPAKIAPSADDTYDIPVDDEEEISQTTKGKKSTKGRKSVPSATTSAKTANKPATKADAKKRQSAPAALGRSVGTRNSQRAAAAKANKQLQGADKSDVEDTEIDDKLEPAKSQAIQKGETAKTTKAKEQPQGDDQSDVDDVDNVKVDHQPAPARSQNTQNIKINLTRISTKTKDVSAEADKVALSPEQDEDMLPLPQAEGTTPSPVQNNSFKRVNADNLYDTTPKKPPQKALPRKLQDPEPTKIAKVLVENKRSSTRKEQSVVEGSEEPAKVAKALKKNMSNSGLDMASKLGNLLEGVGDNPPEIEYQNSVARNEFNQTAEQMKHKPTKGGNENVPTYTKSTKSAGNKPTAVTKSQSPIVLNISDSSSSAAEEGEQHSISPAAPKQTSTFPQEREKLKAADDKVFKKPPIPTRQEQAPIHQEAKEPATVESKLSEVVVNEESGHDTGTSAITNKVINEAQQDTPMESIRDDPETGEFRRKRKAELTVATPPKRQRFDESQNRSRDPSPAASLSSSPPGKTKPSPKQHRKLGNPTEHVAPPRRSPRLMDRARRATEFLQQGTSETASVVKDPDRKPHLVSFGAKGALNQGIYSTIKTLEDCPSPKNMSDEAVKLAGKNRPSTNNLGEEVPKPVRRDNGEHKRKRESLDVVAAEILSHKRRSVSPREAAAVDEDEDGDLPVLQDSPPVEAIKTKSTRDRRGTKPPTRPSSQTSRVDKNGSPMASSQEDHIGKLRERLADKFQDPPSLSAESPVTTHPRRLSEVFGPRVVLEKKPKARKSSPEETAVRYVAHEKTANGAYEEVTTKRVIAPEKKVHDPFTEKGRKTSGFTERLMSGSSTGTHDEAPELREAFMGEKRKGQDAEPTLPLHRRGAQKSTHRPQPTRRAHNPRERTRVEIETQVSDPSMPSEMTVGSSYESRSSEPDHIPPNELPTASAVWNIAIRPHYNNLREAIHRIGDEVILRLQGEEDMMGLLIQQYKEEGGKILSKLEERHTNERVAIVDALNQKRAEMVSMYSEAKELVMDTVKDLKENSTSQFEREWRKRQDAIREQIAEGRKVSEL